MNRIVLRRLYGNRTERSHTSELQLALGDLLAGETELQKALDDAVGKVKNALEPDPSRQVHGTRRRVGGT